MNASNKAHQNCNRNGPVFPPNRFELMSNSSPKRFFSSVRQSSLSSLSG